MRRKNGECIPLKFEHLLRTKLTIQLQFESTLSKLLILRSYVFWFLLELFVSV